MSSGAVVQHVARSRREPDPKGERFHQHFCGQAAAGWVLPSNDLAGTYCARDMLAGAAHVLSTHLKMATAHHSMHCEIAGPAAYSQCMV